MFHQIKYKISTLVLLFGVFYYWVDAQAQDTPQLNAGAMQTPLDTIKPVPIKSLPSVFKLMFIPVWSRLLNYHSFEMQTP